VLAILYRSSISQASFFPRQAQAGERGPEVPLLRYHASMPAPTNERQSLERERADLPSQIAAYEAELDATPPEDTVRREMRAYFGGPSGSML
jgi:hypothetical protein